MRQVAIIFFCIFSFQLAAQDIKVTARVERDTIYIGDQIYYNITVEQPSDLKLNFLNPADTLMRSVLIIDKRGPDSSVIKNQNRVAISMSLLITSFDTGFYDIPPFYVSYNPDGKEIRYYSDFTPLEVINTYITPSDTTDIIFDIVAPYTQSLTAREVIPWILLTLVVAVAVWYIIRRIRNNRKREEDEPLVKMPAEPLHITALRELDRLDRKKLWQKGEMKPFYTDLVLILKQYLSGRFNISCLEMTTYETMDALKYNGLNDEKVQISINEILITADFSKFAKYRPGDDLNSVMIDRAKEIVSQLASEKSIIYPETTDQEKKIWKKDSIKQINRNLEEVSKSDPAKRKDQEREEEVEDGK